MVFCRPVFTVKEGDCGVELHHNCWAIAASMEITIRGCGYDGDDPAQAG